MSGEGRAAALRRRCSSSPTRRSSSTSRSARSDALDATERAELVAHLRRLLAEFEVSA